MTNLLIQSPFKRSNQLEQLIENQFGKLHRFCQNITTARVFLKKEQNTTLSDIVTINIAVKGQKEVTVTVEDSLFEKAIKNAFKIAERQLKKEKR